MEPEDVFGISMILEIESLIRGLCVVNMVISILVKLLNEGGSVFTTVPAIDLDVVFPVEHISSCAAGDLEVVQVVVTVRECGVVATLPIHWSDADMVEFACGSSRVVSETGTMDFNLNRARRRRKRRKPTIVRPFHSTRVSHPGCVILFRQASFDRSRRCISTVVACVAGGKIEFPLCTNLHGVLAPARRLPLPSDHRLRYACNRTAYLSAGLITEALKDLRGWQMPIRKEECSGEIQRKFLPASGIFFHENALPLPSDLTSGRLVEKRSIKIRLCIVSEKRTL